MKISKNKKRAAFAISMILLGIMTIIELNNDKPEDKHLSSGYSDFWENMAKIDNRANILNYNYVSKKKNQDECTTYHLKDMKFTFGKEVIIGEAQYPQGICIAEDYLLVTSYTDEKNLFSECRVFHKITGEHLVTLGMDKDSHLGGITYDGKNIWVCNSAKMKIERIPYSFVHHIVTNYRGSFVDVTNLMIGYKVKNIPSSLFCYENKLYVSTHRKWANSKMVAYQYDEQSDVLKAEGGYRIPAKVQGIALDESGKVYVSTSYGRKISSYLKIYSSIDKMNQDVDIYEEMIEMPPCSEGIIWENQKLYILFESAGKKYLEGTDGKGKSIAPLDKILIIDRA